MRKLAQYILDLHDERGTIDIQTLVTETDDERIRDLVTELVFNPEELHSDWKKMEKEIHRPEPMTIARDAVLQIQKKSLKRAKEENSRAMKEAEMQHLDTSLIRQRQYELSQLLNKLEKESKLL
jgi:hypothetical protein